jgi:hypothetical protein
MARTTDPLDSLRQAVHNFCQAYKLRPAYADVTFQLEQALNQAEALSMSPGRKAAVDAVENNPVPSGQAPTGRTEAPMTYQS